MGDSSGAWGKSNDSRTVELIGKVMVVAVLVLFLVVVFVFFVHLYAKRYLLRRPDNSPNTTTSRRRRRRFDFAPGYQEHNLVAALRRGLDPSVLKTLPVVMFNPQEFKDGLECAVCLSEVSEGEKIRLLPKCNHGFHVACIDMWFQSHPTCPLCRNPVSNQSSLSSTGPVDSSLDSIPERPTQESTTESLNFPTNVLFWGNDTQVSTLGNCLDSETGHQGVLNCDPQSQSASSSSSSSSLPAPTSHRPDGMLVIDIPAHADEDEGQKSPLPTRLRSLKRLLSRDRRLSPRGTAAIDVDLEEQGS